MKFKFIELEKMFFDPLDQIVHNVNQVLLKNKFVKAIFS